VGLEAVVMLALAQAMEQVRQVLLILVVAVAVVHTQPPITLAALVVLVLSLFVIQTLTPQQHQQQEAQRLLCLVGIAPTNSPATAPSHSEVTHGSLCKARSEQRGA
jgi:hypothetical protein